MKKTAVDSTAQQILSGYFGSFAEQLTKKVYTKTKFFLNKKAGLEDGLEPEKISLMGLHHSEDENQIKAEFAIQAHAYDDEGDVVALNKVLAVKVDKVNRKVAFAELDLDQGS